MMQVTPATSTDQAPVSLALIGMGRQGARHLSCAARMHQSVNLRLAAVVDSDPRCAEHAERLGIPFFPNVDQLPAQIDAAIVATPTRTHLEVGRRLLERDIDLLIEKPVACGLSETRALVRLAEQRARIFQVGYLERYHRAFRASTPDFSSPACIASHRTTRGAAIRSIEELVLELMIHDLDMIATWLDRTPSKFDWANIERGANRMSAELEVHYSEGHRARLVAQSGTTDVIRRTRVTAGSREWNFDWRHSDSLSWQTPSGNAHAVDPISAQLRAFVHAVRTRTHPLINGHSALKAMQLAESAIRALPEGT
jgi:predicted dehydrogenase